MRTALSTLAVCMLGCVPIACDETDEPSTSAPSAASSTAAAPFTPEAARTAYQRIVNESNPAKFCSLMTPAAQRLWQRGAERDYGLESATCEEAVAELIRQDPDDSPGRLDADERKDLAIEPEMDRATQTAGFVDEFGNGVVLKRVDGQWLFAGLVTR